MRAERSDLVRRVSRWSVDAGVCQIELALLDSSWESLWRQTALLGPFDSESEIMTELEAAAQQWLDVCGVPLRLF